MKRSSHITHIRGESGIALPLALIGLVAVSLLVTTAIVTSSNEVSLSFAHQRGAKGLYSADEALESFVANRAAQAYDANAPVSRLTNATFDFTLDDGSVFKVTSAELSRQQWAESGTTYRTEIFSILAAPKDRRGRSVGALIRAERESPPVEMNINSGLTLGVNTSVTGNAKISDGSDGTSCGLDATEHAITHGSDHEVEVGGSADIVGTVNQDSRTGEELIAHVFNGLTIDELDNYATIRFGPLYNRAKFTGSNAPSGAHADPNYRWGCPAAMLLERGLVCPGGVNDFPIVAIDAAGETIDIQGDHGQGVLIVRNGTLRIRGNFLYGGIIVAEGRTEISGTPLLEGAVITMGNETIIDPNDSATQSGTSVIRYNRCAVNSAQAGLGAASLDMREQVLGARTFSWFEVVR